MESPTASGKTLSFAVPMLDRLLREPDAHALLIYPTKALALDQRTALEDLCKRAGGDRLQSWPYDGDTESDIRQWLRKAPPPILMTNPEYLNMSFLAYREQWQSFLSRLRYVVLDEVHEYRGFFGSSMAILLRRLFLQFARMGAKPNLFLATATCANPKEHAEALTGCDFTLVQARDSLRPSREFVFVDPKIPDHQYRDVFRLRIERAAVACLLEGLQVLIFCPSKKFLEEAFANAARYAAELGVSEAGSKISPFHADLRPEKRMEVQQRIKAGQVRVVFTTNALELGLDIGGLDGVILAGFPENTMAAWQRVGRAGRSVDKDAFVLFYAMNDPIDQFFVSNVDSFVNKPLDDLVVYPHNPEMIRRHLDALREESGGRTNASDRVILGNALYEAARKSAAPIPKRFKPQATIDLRGTIGQKWVLTHNGREIGQISNERRFREAYLGALFRFMGVKYRVQGLEEGNALVLVEGDAHLRTEPSFYTVPTVKKTDDQAYRAGFGAMYRGVMDIFTGFNGYRVVEEKSGTVKERVDGSGGMARRDLHSFWMEFQSEEEIVREGLGALEHLLRVGTTFVIPVDRFDLGTYSTVGNDCAVYCYENHAGGTGVAKKLWTRWPDALRKGVEVAENCECRSGCPNCIEPPKSFVSASIDKEAGMALAARVLGAFTQEQTE